jgi:hypothetical protein
MLSSELEDKARVMLKLVAAEPVLRVETRLKLATPTNHSQGASWGGVMARTTRRQAHRRKGAMLGALFAPYVRRRGGARVVIRLVRQGARRLDPNNLDSAAKSVVDGLATKLGIDDSAEDQVMYVVDQARGAAGVLVAELYVQEMTPPGRPPVSRGGRGPGRPGPVSRERKPRNL